MMRNTAVILTIGLFLLVTCKPLEIVKYDPLGMRDDIVGTEMIFHNIYRYHKDDTLQYRLHYSLDLINYPPEISSIYVGYSPKLQSGVLGLYGQPFFLFSDGVPQSLFIEDISEDYRFMPLYQYNISNSAMYFRKLAQEEQMQDYDPINDKFLHRSYSDTAFQTIYTQIYDAGYQYFNGRDTLVNPYFKRWDLSPVIPMFALPLDSNIYYKKQLVKKRIGFMGRILEANLEKRFGPFRHEIDTAILSLPVKILQNRYLHTRDFNCLDGQTFPLTWTWTVPYPE
jgi:hypothetical protein